MGAGPSRNVALVPLSAAASAVGVAAALLDLADSAVVPAVPAGFPAPLCLGFKAFRTNLVVSAPPRGGQFGEPATAAAAAPLRYDVTHTLAGIRGADIVVLVIDASPEGLAATAAASAAAAASKTVMVPLAARNAAKETEAAAEPASAAAVGGAGAASSATAAAAAAVTGPAVGEGLVDGEGELFLACLKATGVPALMAVVLGLEAHATPAKAADARRAVQRLLATEFGEEVVRAVEAADPLSYAPSAPSAIGSIPLAPLPLPVAYHAARLPRTSGAGLHLVRGLCSLPLHPVQWRLHRSSLTAQTLHWEPTASGAAAGADAGAGPVGTLSVWGYLKGRPLNVHQLVVMPWGGAYRIADVRSARDAFAKPPGTAKPVAAAGADIALVGGMPALQTAVAAAAAAAAGKGEAGSTYAAIAAAALAATAVAGSGAEAGRPLFAGSRYVPLTAMLLAVPLLAAKVRAIAVGDLDDRVALAGAGAGAAAGAGGSAAADANLLAVPKPELCESLDVVAPPEEGDEDEDEDDDEVEGAAGAGSRGAAGKGKGKARPAGMSRYQASWLVEEGNEDEDDDDEDDEDDDEDGAGAGAGAGAASKGKSSKAAGAGMDASDEESGDADDDEGDEEEDGAAGEEDDDVDGDDVFAEGTMDPNGESRQARIRLLASLWTGRAAFVPFVFTM